MHYVQILLKLMP